jgi:hypothetical protein
MKAEILNWSLSMVAAGMALCSGTTTLQPATMQPNVFIARSGDIGIWNIRANNMGRVGHMTCFRNFHAEQAAINPFLPLFRS